MQLHSDYSERVVIRPGDTKFVPSPLAGVERMMLDRDGGEVARATSIVRYAPGSTFSRHVHTGGEEFLVLEGTFSDEHGDYPAGTYVRNPPGTSHAPFSKDGCTIFVKLFQFHPEDAQRVVINFHDATWQPGPVNGISILWLHQFHGEQVVLVKIAPGLDAIPHTHDGGEEILVLDGMIEDEHGEYPKGAWLRYPPQSRHAPFSRNGCMVYAKSGHLADVISPATYGVGKV